MRYFKSNFLFLLTVSTLVAFTPRFYTPKDSYGKVKIVKWAVQKSSTIRIEGSTNINDFGCDITGYYQPDTIYCSEENAASKQVTLNGDLKVDILKFDCHSRMLTGDLRKTLKVDEYPTLFIRFLSLERAPVIENSKDFLRGSVEVELAGSTRRFEIDYSFIRTGTSSIQLRGQRNFSFADFKLVPPKKFGGLIKVNDKFNVDFNLLLNPVE
jgi:hypothetical protein